MSRYSWLISLVFLVFAHMGYAEKRKRDPLVPPSSPAHARRNPQRDRKARERVRRELSNRLVAEAIAKAFSERHMHGCGIWMSTYEKPRWAR